jgi:hypothetical protein
MVRPPPLFFLCSACLINIFRRKSACSSVMQPPQRFCVDCSVQFVTEAVQMKYLFFLSLKQFGNCLLNTGRKVCFQIIFLHRSLLRFTGIGQVIR